jgi:hypothetical protein
MALAYLRFLLAALLSLGVGDEVDPDAEVPDAEITPDPDADPDADDPTLEAAIDADLDTEPDKDEDRSRRARETRQAEIERVAEETARRVVGTRETAPMPSFEQQYREREEAELSELQRSGATAAQIADKNWEINTNRVLRASDTKATAALFQAAEFNDKGEFRELASDKVQGPIYQAYKDRVERELAELRKKGNNVPRTTLMYYLYGRDRAQGKVKLKSKPAPKKEGLDALPANVRRIDRGRAPGVGARGDVARGGSGRDPHAELMKRLENKRI